jgi:hypothetical protein
MWAFYIHLVLKGLLPPCNSRIGVIWSNHGDNSPGRFPVVSLGSISWAPLIARLSGFKAKCGRIVSKEHV